MSDDFRPGAAAVEGAAAAGAGAAAGFAAGFAAFLAAGFFLAAFFAAGFLIAGFVTAWLAVASDDGLVEDDYYKKGLAINQTIARDQVAQSLDLKAQLMVGSDATQLRVMLQRGESGVLPSTLRLKILHPTRSDMDRVVMLEHSASGYYEGGLKALEPTRWKLILEDADSQWRLTGKLHLAR